jgi:hypothetical protein
MRVKFLKTVMGERTFFKEGSEADIPEERAQEFIRVKYAVPLAAEVETAVSRRPLEKAVRPLRGAQRGA